VRAERLAWAERFGPINALGVLFVGELGNSGVEDVCRRYMYLKFSWTVAMGGGALGPDNMRCQVDSSRVETSRCRSSWIDGAEYSLQ
jgi:hypothetical protein